MIPQFNMVTVEHVEIEIYGPKTEVYKVGENGVVEIIKTVIDNNSQAITIVFDDGLYLDYELLPYKLTSKKVEKK